MFRMFYAYARNPLRNSKGQLVCFVYYENIWQRNNTDPT
ncbi:hypothetical protein R83H12_02390 [Fibrobacteria bacterium R8-3-H12]